MTPRPQKKVNSQNAQWLPKKSTINPKDLVTKNASVQENDVVNEAPLALILEANISPIIAQGTGPIPERIQL